MANIGSYPLNEIITGDSRLLAQSIPDESIDLIFTDPVYENIEDYAWLAEIAKRTLKPKGALLTFQGVNLIKETLLAMDCKYLGQFVWRLKGSGAGNHNKRYGKTIDNGNYLLWFMGWPVNVLPLVWDSYNSDYKRVGFHWQKDPALVSRFITDFTKPNSIVFDPFCGSGTIPAMCKKTGRNFMASEGNPKTAEQARSRVLQTVYAPTLAKPNTASSRLFEGWGDLPAVANQSESDSPA